MPSFVFSPLLWGLVAVAAPVLIHLINMMRHQRVQWAAMEFLLASYKKHRTWVWLKQLILQKRFQNLELALIEFAFEQIKKSTPRVPAVTRSSLENADDFNVEAGLLRKEEKLKSHDGLFTNDFVQ